MGQSFKPSEYSIENAIKEAVRYNGGIYVGDNYVTKDHGDYIEVKYSLQGTTQGRYLTGGVPPVRFSM